MHNNPLLSAFNKFSGNNSKTSQNQNQSNQSQGIFKNGTRISNNKSAFDTASFSSFRTSDAPAQNPSSPFSFNNQDSFKSQSFGKATAQSDFINSGFGPSPFGNQQEQSGFSGLNTSSSRNQFEFKDFTFKESYTNFSSTQTSQFSDKEMKNDFSKMEISKPASTTWGSSHLAPKATLIPSQPHSSFSQSFFSASSASEMKSSAPKTTNNGANKDTHFSGFSSNKESSSLGFSFTENNTSSTNKAEAESQNPWSLALEAATKTKTKEAQARAESNPAQQFKNTESTETVPRPSLFGFSIPSNETAGNAIKAEYATRGIANPQSKFEEEKWKLDTSVYQTLNDLQTRSQDTGREPTESKFAGSELKSELDIFKEKMEEKKAGSGKNEGNKNSRRESGKSNEKNRSDKSIYVKEITGDKAEEVEDVEGNIQVKIDGVMYKKWEINEYRSSAFCFLPLVPPTRSLCD